MFDSLTDISHLRRSDILILYQPHGLTAMAIKWRTFELWRDSLIESYTEISATNALQPDIRNIPVTHDWSQVE